MTVPIIDALREHVLLCDGGTGSRVQAMTLDIERDYWNQENCTEVLNLSRPDLVRDIARGYFAAGADMVETNTFGGSPITLEEFGLGARAREINRIAASWRARPPVNSATAGNVTCSAASAPALSCRPSATSPTTRWNRRSPNNRAVCSMAASMRS